jgi:hypothetical protein
MAEASPSPYPAAVYNIDIVYIADKIARYTYEVIKSVSANLAATNEFDMARMLRYLDDVDAAVTYILKQPQLDMPESHPVLHPIEALPEVPDMESDELDHVVRLLRAGYIEAVNSQSARMPAGLQPFDARRVSALVAKTRQWLTEYVKERQPMDLPESSPQEPMTGAGRPGV